MKFNALSPGHHNVLLLQRLTCLPNELVAFILLHACQRVLETIDEDIFSEISDLIGCWLNLESVRARATGNALASMTRSTSRLA